MASILGMILPVAGSAQADETEDWNAWFQSTYIWQAHSSFPAAYSGPNSLAPTHEKSYSFTATAALGFRPWANGELYFDPEMAQGVAMSNLTGLGGFTNGELARTSGARLKIYRARLFLRQTWNSGGAREQVESAANQLAGLVEQRRWVLTAGNLSVLDLFDNNAYSHDPRTQFFNWTLMTHGAYDYAADARGYSWGIAMERYWDNWVLRAGRFLLPTEPNQSQMDTRLFRHYGDQIEIEHSHVIGDQPGKIRFLAFHDRARMARYADALTLAAQTGTVPDINNVRNSDQGKYGYGLNAEQALTDELGLFGRASWADGETETYAFTEVDRSVSGGLLAKGSSWGRGEDTLGIAMVQNALSKAHRDYLAAGGTSFFLGDGMLNYRPESVFESFYDIRVTKLASLTVDWQYIRNPGYNADRGPVAAGAIRLHTEF